MTRIPAASILILLLGALCAACGPGGEPEGWPERSLVAGDAGAAREVLERLAGFRGTPLGRAAGELRGRLEGCARVATEGPPGRLGALLEDLRCDAPPGEVEAVVRERLGDGDVVFLLRPEAGASESWVAGTARVAPDGSVDLDVRIGGVEGLRNGAAAALLWPGDEPPGPPRLSARESLVHVRLRPAGGIDLASLVPEGGQGDRMFRLKSELFAGTVLDGAWEAAVHLPPEGRRMPLMALGLDVKSRRLAVSAMERFVEDLERTWSLRRVPFAVGSHEGACLPRLRLMPELAPCYVATEAQLVVGWNPASLRSALAEQRGAGEAAQDGARLGAAGGLLLHLDRFGEADRRLARAYGPEASPVGIDYAWRRLLARVTPGPGGLSLAVRLPAAEPSQRLGAPAGVLPRPGRPGRPAGGSRSEGS